MKHPVPVWAIVASLAWSMCLGTVHSLAAQSPKLLEDALKGPMAGAEEIIFAVRAPGRITGTSTSATTPTAPPTRAIAKAGGCAV